MPSGSLPSILCFKPKIACFGDYIHLAWSMLNKETAKYELYYCRIRADDNSIGLEKFITQLDDDYEALISEIEVNKDGNISILYEKANLEGVRKLGYRYSEDNGDNWEEKDTVTVEVIKEEGVIFRGGAGGGTWRADIKVPEGYTIYDADFNINNQRHIIGNRSYSDGNTYHVIIDYLSRRWGIVRYKLKPRVRCITRLFFVFCSFRFERVPVYGWIPTPRALWNADYIIRASKDDMTADDPYNDVFNPVLSIDDDDNIIIALSDNINQNAELYSQSFSEEQGIMIWHDKQKLTENNYNSYNPAIDFNNLGGNLVWQNGNSAGNNDIYYKSTSDVGKTWTIDRNISDNSSESKAPALGKRTPDKNIIAWYDNASGNYDIMISMEEGRHAGEIASSLAGLQYSILNNSHAFKISVLGALIGSIYDITHVSGSSQFENPFIIKFYYSDSDVMGIDENTLNVFKYDEVNDIWDVAVLDNSLIERNVDENYVALTLTQLSLFALVAPYDVSSPQTALSIKGSSFSVSNIVYVNSYSILELNAVDFDGSGVRYIEFRTNYSKWRQYDEPLDFSLGQSNYILIEYRSVDNVGNFEDINYQTIGVDIEAPEADLLISGIASSNYHVSKTNKYYFDSVDLMSGTKNIYYSIDNSDYAIFTNEFSLEESGEHKIKFKSIDNVDNWEEENIISVFVDTFKPVISITGISNDKYYNQNVQIEISITEDSTVKNTNLLNGGD